MGARIIQPRPKRWAEYSAWIKRKLKQDDPFGQCAEWTLEMQAAFPELRRVRGQVLLSCLWERDHWWLVVEEGGESHIVDPTAEQFRQKYFAGGSKVLTYNPRDESEPEPTGLCCNCGEYCYDGRTELCSTQCERAYHAYLMDSLR